MAGHCRTFLLGRRKPPELVVPTHYKLACRRWLASSSSSSSKAPGQPVKAWESGAISVKNTDTTNPYLEMIRDTHDPSLHLKTIEDELKSTIGKALGRQGEKILVAVHDMNKEYRNYQDLLERYQHNPNHPLVAKSARQYNEHRANAMQARWELVVHRQAAGFIVNNHKYVMEHYPIADALPVVGEDDDDNDDDNNMRNEDCSDDTSNSLGDQLDWWQRIGRWK